MGLWASDGPVRGAVVLPWVDVYSLCLSSHMCYTCVCVCVCCESVSSVQSGGQRKLQDCSENFLSVTGDHRYLIK